MSISKQITLENGISTNYHRIVSVNSIVNVNTIIQIASYISQQQRDTEKNTQNKTSLAITWDFITKDYIESFTVKDAYNFLKTTEKYSNGLDV